jgi:SMI1/KNR4 family protein SUKH-1
MLTITMKAEWLLFRALFPQQASGYLNAFDGDNTMALNLTKSGQRLSEADLRAIEERYGFRFPSEYKDFLLTFNGGKPDRWMFRLKGKRVYGECVHYFLSMSDDPNISFHVYFRRYKVDAKRLPDEVIPVAFDPGGNLICLAVKGTNEGKVFFWDHEAETSGRGERGENLRLIADSFREFTDGLKEED